ncbi:hypothetical protein BX661DRAFT_205909 [Kickxella alabastrina]|uniref:uncharacterized protein n=1 Tax=Kickxella alabastrina TaxID=61397 RepID=UPI002220EBA7|nr:uncharacterized protein BX661DRAFT_205909 [Kickxella alabastrina]KAI7826291.1 hypothetical protein BX661DRAFT_205909 [Kickxella alabastrina]
MSTFIFLALLGESWLLLRTSLEPITVERDLHTMWQNKYNDNKRQLLWYEHFYGCCGFKNATDMPSSKQCDDYAVLDYPAHGCLRFMRQDVFHHSKLALQWCLLAIVVQLVVIAFGYSLYNLVFTDDTTWLPIESADINVYESDVDGFGGSGRGGTRGGSSSRRLGFSEAAEGSNASAMREPETGADPGTKQAAKAHDSETEADEPSPESPASTAHQQQQQQQEEEEEQQNESQDDGGDAAAAAASSVSAGAPPSAATAATPAAKPAPKQKGKHKNR